MARRDGSIGDSSGDAATKGKRGRRRRSGGRLSQIRQTYAMTARVDKKLPWVMLAWFVGVAGGLLALAVLVDSLWLLGPFALMSGVLAALIVFGRRAERAAYKQIEGQPGAAAAVLRSLRRGWTVTEGVAVTPTRDVSQAAVLHRATGRPGVVLVAEGPPSRASHLLAQEKKRLARVVPDTPVYEVHVGTGDGQTPLTKLQRTLVKLPRNIRPGQAAEVERRLKALSQGPVAMPKGPLPKGARMPRPPKAPGR